MVGVADRGEAVGERGDAVPLAGQNVPPRHLKRVADEVPPSPEVASVPPCSGLDGQADRHHVA